MNTFCQSPIEPACAGEISQLARLLTVSLVDDPLQRWLFPDDKRRLATSERVFRRLLRPKVAQGLVRVIRDAGGQVASVAVWTPPHPPAPSRWERYAESFFMRLTYGKRIHEVRRGFTALADRHPREPYWYLQALVTAPQARSQGQAARLLREQISLCGSTQELIALETSQPTNLTYYQKFGFHVANELLLVEGLPVWLMCRRADA